MITSAAQELMLDCVLMNMIRKKERVPQMILLLFYCGLPADNIVVIGDIGLVAR